MLLPLAHLCVVWALVWVYARVVLGGSTAVRGMKLGLFGWIVGAAPLWMLWYAEEPWPDSLVVKQLSLKLASSLIIGITITAVAGRVHVDV